MLTIKVLGSSSSGNCGLLVCNEDYYLIDAGFSGKKTKEKLSKYGIDLHDISGIFITHEHHDHTQGLKVFSKVKNIKFYANYKTAQAIENKHKLNAPWCIFDSEESFFIKNLLIQTFLVPHDAAEPVGFLFKSDATACAWVTDIGHITEKIEKILVQADTLVIESNHDINLLWNHPERPLYLKERVAGDHGHLSNHDAYKFIKNAPHHWKTVCLSHISKDCNSIHLLNQLFQPLAQQQKFELEIIDPILEN